MWAHERKAKLLLCNAHIGFSKTNQKENVIQNMSNWTEKHAVIKKHPKREK
jgi:hypothetical protein